MSETTTTTVASLSEVLRFLAAEFDASMPEPSALNFYTYEGRSPIVGLSFRPEGAACVETWIAKYASKYSGTTRQPHNEGTEWLTTDAFELMGVTVQLTGHDPREPETQADAAVLVAEAVAVLDDCTCDLNLRQVCDTCQAVPAPVKAVPAADDRLTECTCQVSNNPPCAWCENDGGES